MAYVAAVAEMRMAHGLHKGACGWLAASGIVGVMTGSHALAVNKKLRYLEVPQGSTLRYLKAAP